jgi:hypothetical protein
LASHSRSHLRCLFSHQLQYRLVTLLCHAQFELLLPIETSFFTLPFSHTLTCTSHLTYIVIAETLPFSFFTPSTTSMDTPSALSFQLSISSLSHTHFYDLFLPISHLHSPNDSRISLFCLSLLISRLLSLQSI